MAAEDSSGQGSGRTSERPPSGLQDGAVTARSLQAGMIVAGKFALVRRLSHDASTEVFEAEDTLMGRRVALRALLPKLASNADHVRRFRREAHVTASVAHPSVVAVFEIGRRSDGALYVVHELLDGPTLESHLIERRRLPETEALALVRPIVGALAAAHAVGVVHRDVAPANILLVHAPFSEMAPKLIGFRVGRPAGAPANDARYLAPEQVIANGWVDGRTDVWAIGVVLYELLCGAVPFETSASSARQQPQRLDARVPDVRIEVADLVHRCLDPDSNGRPEMQAVHLELARLTGRPSTPNEVRTTLRPAEGVDPDSIILTEADLEEIELVDLEPDDEPASTLRPARVDTAHDWMRATTEADSDFARESEVPAADADIAADAAQRALRVNALEEAVLYAEEGIAAIDESCELLGQLHLVRTIAEHWLGHSQQSLQGALAAMELLPRGATSWHTAFGYEWLARARLGRLEALPGAADPAMSAGPKASAAQVIAASRLSVAMIRAGSLTRARHVVRAARERLDRNAADEPAVHAWLDVSFAERAAFVGDLPRELSGRVSALERFTSAGDVRNACEQRAAMGAILLRLGAFEEAERVLHEALGIAAPMKLAVARTIKAYLGFAAFRQGEPARALSLASEALAELRETGDRHGEGLCQAFLALIFALHDDHSRALAAAEAAVTAAEPFPCLFAHALGVQGATLLFVGRTEQALRPASHAMELLSQHGGAGEGEGLLRLTYALAIAQTGDKTESRRAMKAARDRVVGLAERVSDPRHKQSFLEKISENARIVQLGSEWLDDGS